jgi:hypothetical protein
MNFFRQTTALDIVRQQRIDAERLRLEHLAAAEHHKAFADMYSARCNRLDAEQSNGFTQSSAQGVAA